VREADPGSPRSRPAESPFTGTSGTWPRIPLLLLFLDGVGIGLPDPEVNPFLQAHLPRLRRLLGGHLPTLGDVRTGVVAGEGVKARVHPLDATLGVEGLPQSGTGQISLLAGVNAAALFGRHFGPWPPTALRALLAESNLLLRARQRGARVGFANAYPAGWPGSLPTRRHAAPPLAALSAGVLVRDVEDLVRGQAVASEIENEGWRRYTGREDLPRITPAEAGRTLARIAGGADLTLFAHYTTDAAGHRGGMQGGRAALERVDAFLGGIVDETLDAVGGAGGGGRGGLHLVVASDHGNVEDVRGGHTRNPVLGLEVRIPPCVGPQGGSGRDAPPGVEPPATPPRSDWILEGVTDLTGVAPALLQALRVQTPQGRTPPDAGAPGRPP
jgi:2,3-bisphosphoglycerate-independent phosphoglycerate mutase